MRIHSNKTEKVYIITQKELKSLLNLDGDIVSIELWEGQSPNQEEAGESKDNIEYSISTERFYTNKGKKNE